MLALDEAVIRGRSLFVTSEHRSDLAPTHVVPAHQPNEIVGVGIDDGPNLTESGQHAEGAVARRAGYRSAYLLGGSFKEYIQMCFQADRRQIGGVHLGEGSGRGRDANWRER